MLVTTTLYCLYQNIVVMLEYEIKRVLCLLQSCQLIEAKWHTRWGSWDLQRSCDKNSVLWSIKTVLSLEHWNAMRVADFCNKTYGRYLSHLISNAAATAHNHLKFPFPGGWLRHLLFAEKGRAGDDSAALGLVCSCQHWLGGCLRAEFLCAFESLTLKHSGFPSGK